MSSLTPNFFSEGQKCICKSGSFGGLRDYWREEGAAGDQVRLVQQSLVVWLMVVIELGSMLVVVIEFGLIE